MAYAFDVFIVLLIVASPFLLPFLATIGPVYRIASGILAIFIGGFLVVALWFSSLIDWETHWFLGNFLIVISLVLLPISLLLFAVAPPLYIGFGIRILIKKKNESAEFSTITKFWLVISFILLGIYITVRFLLIGPS